MEQTPRAVFSDNVTQWSIFDAYNEDYDLQVPSVRIFEVRERKFAFQQKAKEKEHKKSLAKKDEEKKKKFIAVDLSV